MHIRLERSGGFAGLRQTQSISSDELLPDEEKRMRDLVESAHFFELPTVLRSPTPGADRFQYKISVETEQFKHTIQFDEGATPAQLRPLLAWLKQAAHKE